MENFDVFRLDGHSLRVFVALCETRSVSRTAEQFNLNQSTVSYTLDKLRSAVGDPLFVKSGRGITPTEKALEMTPRVQEVLAGIEGLVTSENFDPARETRSVVLAIATPALLDMTRAFQRRLYAQAPDAVFELRRLAPREKLREILESSDADIAVTVANLTYPAVLKHQFLCDDELVVYYDPNERGPIRSVEDYAAARHAVAGFGGRHPSIVEQALATVGLERKIALVSPTTSMLGDLVRGTDLITTMPLALHRAIYSGLAHCPPPISLPRVAYDLVWHRRYDHSGRSRWLRELVLEANAMANAEATSA